MEYLKPNFKKIILFLIFSFILLSSLLLPEKNADWFLVIYLARVFIFLPIHILKGILVFFLGNGGDFFFTPGYLEVLICIVGIIYAYVLSSLLLDPFTSVKWNKIFRFALFLFLVLVGTLFLVWQFNPHLDPTSNMYKVMRSVYGWLVAAIICYSSALWLIHKNKKAADIVKSP